MYKQIASASELILLSLFRLSLRGESQSDSVCIRLHPNALIRSTKETHSFELRTQFEHVLVIDRPHQWPTSVIFLCESPNRIFEQHAMQQTPPT